MLFVCLFFMQKVIIVIMKLSIMSKLIGNVHVGKTVPILMATEDGSVADEEEKDEEKLKPKRLLLTPRVFNSDKEDVFGWLTNYEMVGRANQWRDSEMIQHLPIFCEGAAFQYLSTLPTPYDEWKTAKDDLLKVFGPTNSKEYYFEEMSNCRQKDGTSCRKYVFEKLQRIRQWNPDIGEDEKVLLVQRGLNKVYRERTYGRHYGSVNELLEKLTMLEEATKIAAASSNEYDFNFAAKTEDTTIAAVDTLPSKTDQPMLCWICNSDKHFKRSCPDLRCSYCHRKGHTVKFCFRKQDREEGQSFKQSHFHDRRQQKEPPFYANQTKN